MTIAAAVAFLSFAIACYVAALSRRFSRAPGWRDQRYFSWAAIAVAGYSALNIPTTARLDGAVVVQCSRLQLGLAAVHTIAWIRYSAIHLGGPPARWERRIAVPALAIAGALATFTPWAHPGGVFETRYAPFGFSYVSPVTTPFGSAVIALLLGLLLVPVVRFARAARRGVPGAAVHAASLAFLLAMGVNDALALERIVETPYLVDLGFLVPIAAVGYVLTARFVEDARTLEALRGELEHAVAQRTRELGHTQEALLRAEKLAALGQFAAGVAHEVNNPSAVVSANLRYLEEAVAGGALPADAPDALRESLVAMERIAGIVRQLLDASRLAASSAAAPVRVVEVRAAVEEAIRMAVARCGARVRFQHEVAPGLHAAAQDTVLVQVLVNLVVNGAQAVPQERADGVVRVRTRREGERLHVEVEDNGTGMDEEVLRRVFEPFFTTKPFGTGTGLGLAVSRGLLASFGGDLRLESRPGHGTRATIDLPATMEAAAAPAPPPRPAGPRRRLLLVDDEPGVRTSLKRLLETRYDVALAAGVEEGLAALADRSARGAAFDAVLCDVMMPDGGGERLFERLRARDPTTARRVVFFTGGAVTDDARRFLREQPQPVLAKPLDLALLGEVVEGLGGRAAA
jgi:signal transduction histidine kinase